MLYDGPVVGVSFEPSRTNLQNLYSFVIDTVNRIGDIELDVQLIHNPTNPWDNNAVQVYVGYKDTMFFIGHIPKTHNTSLLKVGLANLKSEFIRFNYADEEVTPIGVTISVNYNDQLGFQNDFPQANI